MPINSEYFKGVLNQLRVQRANSSEELFLISFARLTLDELGGLASSW